MPSTSHTLLSSEWQCRNEHCYWLCVEINSWYCRVLSDSTQKSFMKDISKCLIPTLVRTMFNPTWKLDFGTQSVETDSILYSIPQDWRRVESASSYLQYSSLVLDTVTFSRNIRQKLASFRNHEISLSIAVRPPRMVSISCSGASWGTLSNTLAVNRTNSLTKW